MTIKTKARKAATKANGNATKANGNSTKANGNATKANGKTTKANIPVVDYSEKSFMVVIEPDAATKAAMETCSLLIHCAHPVTGDVDWFRYHSEKAFKAMPEKERPKGATAYTTSKGKKAFITPDFPEQLRPYADCGAFAIGMFKLGGKDAPNDSERGLAALFANKKRAEILKELGLK